MGISAEDYRDQLLNLFPRGRAWARNITSTMAKLCHAIADEFARLDQREDDLMEEADPRTSSELLTDYERVLNLPDTCSNTINPTIEERRAAVVGRYLGIGGHNIPYLISVASRMGYTIDIIDKVTPHHYEINVHDVPITRLSVGEGAGHTVGTALRTYGDEQALECVMMRLNQAHAVPTFTYEAFNETVLFDPEGDANDYYAFSVALSSDGDTAIVGAYAHAVGANANQGSVYVYTRTAGVWTQQQQLTAGDGAADDYFGRSVGLSSDGDTAIVGAHADNVGANADQGSAYVYTRTVGVWTQQQQLTAGDGAANDRFGSSVALSSDGDTAIVGAYAHAVGANANQGSAYVYTRTAGVWTQQQQLTAGDGATNDRFGSSVTLSNDGHTAIVGAYTDDVGANANQGSAYVYMRTTGVWTQQQQLTAGDGAANDRFGFSVALSSDGDTAIVGAHADDVGANIDQGSAHIFDNPLNETYSITYDYEVQTNA